MKVLIFSLLAFLALGLIPLHAQPNTAPQDSGKAVISAPPENPKKDTVYIEPTDKAIERQFGLYDFVLKTFSIILAVFAVGSVIGGYIGYRDRQTMKEEYREKKKELDDLIAQKKKELEDLALKNESTINKLIKDNEYRLNEKFGIFESFIAQKSTEIDNRCTELGINIKIKEIELDGWINKVLSKASKFDAAMAEKMALPPESASPIIKEAVEAYNKGIEIYKKGSYTEAEVKFRRAAELMPDDPEAHYNHGVALWKSGKAADAEMAFRAAIRLKPDYAWAYNNLGFILDFQEGKEEEAIKMYKEVTRYKPGDATGHYNLGLALAKQKKFGEAIVALSEASRLDPDDAEAHYSLACCYAEQGAKKDALKSLEQAVDKGYDDWPLMEKDEYLKNLREDPRFKALAEKVKARWEEKQKKEGKGK